MSAKFYCHKALHVLRMKTYCGFMRPEFLQFKWRRALCFVGKLLRTRTHIVLQRGNDMHKNWHKYFCLGYRKPIKKYVFRVILRNRPCELTRMCRVMCFDCNDEKLPKPASANTEAATVLHVNVSKRARACVGNIRVGRHTYMKTVHARF